MGWTPRTKNCVASDKIGMLTLRAGPSKRVFEVLYGIGPQKTEAPKSQVLLRRICLAGKKGHQFSLGLIVGIFNPWKRIRNRSRSATPGSHACSSDILPTTAPVTSAVVSLISYACGRRRPVPMLRPDDLTLECPIRRAGSNVPPSPNGNYALQS